MATSVGDAASAAGSAAGARRAVDRWQFGPIPDLLLGAGGVYWLLFAAMVLFGTRLSELAPISLLPLVVLFTGVPHYGATLVRVCERPDDRRAYSLVTIGTSVATIAALALCLRSVFLGSLLLTVYLTWSPWHYSGQNYGIALMMLGRRGVAVSPRTKRWLYASFCASFALIVLSINGALQGVDYAPVAYEGTVYRHLTLGIPDAVRLPLMAVVAVVYAVSLGAAATGLLRCASLRDLGPAAAVAASQGLWFAVPALARAVGVFQESGPLSVEMAAYAFVWIGVAHSVQYLWVTSYFAMRSSGVPVRPRAAARRAFLLRYGAKVLASGAALWVLPALFFAPGALGRLPFDAGLAVMIAAAVNIHHFALDGVIWKLRDGRIAQVLLRGQTADAGAPIGVAPVVSRRAARAVAGTAAWAIGAASVLVFGGGVLEQELGLERALARSDHARAARAIERLAWIGRDSAANRRSFGLSAADRGDVESGIAQLERAVGLHETEPGLAALGTLYARGGRRGDAEAAYRKAVALAPDEPEALNNLAWLLATDGDPTRAPEAVELAERASSALRHESPNALDTLAAAYAAAGRFKAARRTARRAIALAQSAGAFGLAREIETHLAIYRENRPLTQ